MLQINNLHATVGDKPILKSLTLTLNAGEIHAIIGPKGAHSDIYVAAKGVFDGIAIRN